MLGNDIGADQKQHLELTRDIAQRANALATRTLRKVQKKIGFAARG